jgi:hypothetical protein
MLHKKGNKEPGNATLASVKKEMAKPRVAKSARVPVPAETYVNLAAVPKRSSNLLH